MHLAAMNNKIMLGAQVAELFQISVSTIEGSRLTKAIGADETGGRGETMVIAAGFEPGDALAVTIEEQGGSPTAAPTTDPLFVLATA